jgi:hypothetical protein
MKHVYDFAFRAALNFFEFDFLAQFQEVCW